MALKNIQIQQQEQTQVQQQMLTPQQVLLVRLTEMPLDALQQRVEIECLENPWLEKRDVSDADGADMYDGVSEAQGKDADSDAAMFDGDDEGQGKDYHDSANDATYDYGSEDDIPPYLLYAQNSDSPEENIEYGDTLSFYDQLKEQMIDYELTEHQKALLEYLIGSLDEDGLLKKSLMLLADEAEIYQGLYTSVEELTEALAILWEFDPAGIGARSLQECLSLQIKRENNNPYQELMGKVIDKFYDDFIHKRWTRIQTKLHLTPLQSRELQSELMKLNPRPGSALGEKAGSVGHQIIPDFIVESDGYDSLSVSLNQGNVPSLVISPDAKEKLDSYAKKGAAALSKSMQDDLQFTRKYVEKGQIFINALAQRRISMLQTMQAIIHLQRAFFLEGDETLLRPMILEDVANDTGYDISTISRVCSGKYVQTPFGTYPLKWFFNHKAIQTSDEETVTTHQVMAVLKEVIDAENKEAPLSDEKLTAILQQKGFNIARRTIAKYREQMGIPVARMRK